MPSPDLGATPSVNRQIYCGLTRRFGENDHARRAQLVALAWTAGVARRRIVEVID